MKYFVFIFSLLFSFVAVAQSDADTLGISENVAAVSGNSVKVQQGIRKTNILIFPNPTSGLITVRIEYDAKNVSMQLFGQSGRCMLNKKLRAPADNLLDLRGLSAGVYMYRVFENYKQIDAGKLIISR
ncbi:MAG: T9SS type A sorting domain-containing protein [Bacteroidales bacterium]|nr:T9SS type A sorting domain-containing protein [Bacteroidales bacterium]